MTFAGLLSNDTSKHSRSSLLISVFTSFLSLEFFIYVFCDPGVDEPPGSHIAHDAHAFRVIHPFFIWPVLTKGLINIDTGNEPVFFTQVFPGFPKWIPGTIELLVMQACPFGDVFKAIYLTQNNICVLGMGLHVCKFCF